MSQLYIYVAYNMWFLFIVWLRNVRSKLDPGKVEVLNFDDEAVGEELVGSSAKEQSACDALKSSI